MKRDDAILIIGTMVLSAILAILVTTKLTPNSASTHRQIVNVSTINTVFKPPSNQYLNSKSIDPTLLVRIGSNSNNEPFSQ
jgi:hypothetical protein